MKTSRLLVWILAGTALMAACGDADGTITTNDGDTGAPQLDGREFHVVSAAEDGEVRTIVAGTTISLRFSDGSVSASAGCNSMAAGYRVDDKTLLVDSMAMTEMGCDPARHDQDEFVAAFLASQPEISADGDHVLLRSSTGEFRLLDRELADPDRPIVGTDWIVDGFLDGDVAMSMATERPATIRFIDDSSLVGFDGCAEFTMNVEVSDGSIGGPIDGDGELQFGPIEWPDDACADTAEGVQAYADQFRMLFATGEATIEVNAGSMTIVNARGQGLTLRAE